MRRQLILLFVVLIASVSAEIIVNQPGVDHQFLVNKYFTTTPEVPSLPSYPHIAASQEQPSYSVEQCGSANVSFTLSNPNTGVHTYAVSLDKFEGIAYYPQQVTLRPQQAAKVKMVLQPHCDRRGIMNPTIMIRSAEESAQLPMVLNIIPQQTADTDSCESQFNETVCSSAFYIRMYEDTDFSFDLDDWFYDPDDDELSYSAQYSPFINVDIDGSEVTLNPDRDWYGTQQIIFSAEDDQGGKAFSRTFYIHVLDQEDRGFMAWLRNLFS